MIDFTENLPHCFTAAVSVLTDEVGSYTILHSAVSIASSTYLHVTSYCNFFSVLLCAVVLYLQSKFLGDILKVISVLYCHWFNFISQ